VGEHSHEAAPCLSQELWGRGSAERAEGRDASASALRLSGASGAGMEGESSRGERRAAAGAEEEE